MNARRALCFNAISALVLCINAATGAIYHVSPTGDDGNAGTENEPWQTLGRAASGVVAGDTVLVNGGVYNEFLLPGISGSDSDWIEFLAKPGETPVIDGSGLRLTSSKRGLVCIDGSGSYIRLQGFTIRNMDNRTSSGRDPIGIAICENAHHIEIVDCVLHDLSTHLEGRTPKAISIDGATHNISIRGGSISKISTLHPDGNAHAIAVYGEQTTAVDGVKVESVEMFDLTLGTSETLVFNGNVTNFKAMGNTIHDSNNIGIDIIGFEGVGPRGLDQARNGIIADNVVFNISTRDNPAYQEYTAAGIYVDGGRDLIIERNRIFNCDIGVELACEHSSGVTSRVTVRDNVVWRNSIGGILLGGYDRRRGATEDCIINNNTFFANDTRRFEIGEVNIRYRADHNIFTNNIFYAGAQGYLITFPREFADSVGNSFDGNGYFTSSRTAGWEWEGRWISSFSGFQSISGQDDGGIYTNPQFVSTPGDGSGLSLKARSPLIDQGLVIQDAAHRTDAAGNPRLTGERVDIGAFEFGGGTVPVAQITALDIVGVTDERVVTVLPAGADLSGVQIQFSLDGEVWETIASRTEAHWVLIDGVRAEVSNDHSLLVDSRPVAAGLYRAVVDPRRQLE